MIIILLSTCQAVLAFSIVKGSLSLFVRSLSDNLLVSLLAFSFLESTFWKPLYENLMEPNALCLMALVRLIQKINRQMIQMVHFLNQKLR